MLVIGGSGTVEVSVELSGSSHTRVEEQGESRVGCMAFKNNTHNPCQLWVGYLVCDAL